MIIQALSIGLDLSSLPITAKLKPDRTHVSHAVRDHEPDLDRRRWQRLERRLKPPIPKDVAKRPAAPDVRAQFDALPEVSP